MTDKSFPITPPPELVQQWFKQAHESADPYNQLSCYDFISTAAAQWGWEQRGAANEAELQQARDEELNECCEWLDFYSSATDARDLRLARRHEPPSLKEQALETLRSMQIDPVVINGVTVNAEVMAKYDTIRRALEQLND